MCIFSYIVHCQLYCALLVILCIASYIVHCQLYCTLPVILRIASYIVHCQLYCALPVILCIASYIAHCQLYKNCISLFELKHISFIFRIKYLFIDTSGWCMIPENYFFSNIRSWTILRVKTEYWYTNIRVNWASFYKIYTIGGGLWLNIIYIYLFIHFSILIYKYI